LQRSTLWLLPQVFGGTGFTGAMRHFGNGSTSVLGVIQLAASGVVHAAASVCRPFKLMG
jgi:hypothetical protein